jgi:N-acetylglucosaminyldiphosphoundecaprenol N-acetyl-beta-D-mannosaminyltransferase
MTPNRTLERAIWYSKLLPKYWSKELEDLVYDLTNLQTKSPFIVLTPNLNHLRVVEKFPQGKQEYLDSDLLVADGMPIHWINKIAFKIDTPRISGIDLTAAMIRSGENFSVIGSSKEVVAQACARLGRRIESMNILDANVEFTNLVQDSKLIIDFFSFDTSRIVFVAMNTQKQLMIMRIVRESIPGSIVVIGVGGSFDVLSGLYLRAPLILQRLGLEWLWRAIQNPRNMFPRYGSDLMYLFRFAISICQMKLSSRGTDDFE